MWSTGCTHRRVFAAVACLAWLVLLPGYAFAHVPVLEPSERSVAVLADSGLAGSRAVEPPDESRAIYGTLAPEERADAYRFEAPRDVETTIELLAPTSFGASGATSPLQLSVFDLKEGDATQADPVSGKAFFEPFSLQRFRVVARATYRFEAGSSYTIVVAPTGPAAWHSRPAPYVIAFSGAERFTPRDWLSSAVSVPRIWFGLYGQGAPRWGMIAGALVVLGALAFVFVRRIRRARRWSEATLSRSSTVE